MMGYSSWREANYWRRGHKQLHGYWQRQRRRQQLPESGQPIMPARNNAKLTQIADTTLLIETYKRLQREGGQAPGPDGVRYGDLGRGEIAEAMRTLSREILAGEYRPGGARQVRILKVSGGTRTLRLSGICDRVVAARLHAIFTPVWERVFLPQSHGFRADRGVATMLAHLEWIATTHDRWVIVADDIRNAFDNVPICLLVDDHRRCGIHGRATHALIDTVLRGGDPRRTIGIDQGSAYSPTCLNARLHHAHDVAIAQSDAHPFWLRYADNLVYLCQDVPGGYQVLDQVRQLLHPHFQLKGTSPINLKDDATIQLLGCTLSHEDGHLKVDLGEEAWQHLDRGLGEIHRTGTSSRMANQAIMGWITSLGIASESGRDSSTYERIHAIAAHHGFREVPSQMEMLRLWEQSHEKWLALRDRTHQYLSGISEGVGAPPTNVVPG